MRRGDDRRGGGKGRPGDGGHGGGRPALLRAGAVPHRAGPRRVLPGVGGPDEDAPGGAGAAARRHRGQELRPAQRPAGALPGPGRLRRPAPPALPVRRGGGAGRGRGPCGPLRQPGLPSAAVRRAVRRRVRGLCALRPGAGAPAGLLYRGGVPGVRRRSGGPGAVRRAV